MENGSGIKIPLSIVIAVIIATAGAIWTLQTARQDTIRTQTECIVEVEKQVESNTRRIKSLENSVEGLPEKISEISTDIRYLRKSVEMWNQKFFSKGEEQ